MTNESPTGRMRRMVGKGPNLQQIKRDSPEAKQIHAAFVAVLGDRALGHIGPLTPDQEAELRNYYDGVWRLYER